MKLYSTNQEKTIGFFEKLFPFQVFFLNRWNRNEISKITETEITRAIQNLIIVVH